MCLRTHFYHFTSIDSSFTSTNSHLIRMLALLLTVLNRIGSKRTQFATENAHGGPILHLNLMLNLNPIPIQNPFFNPKPKSNSHYNCNCNPNLKPDSSPNPPIKCSAIEQIGELRHNQDTSHYGIFLRTIIVLVSAQSCWCSRHPADTCLPRVNSVRSFIILLYVNM